MIRLILFFTLLLPFFAHAENDRVDCTKFLGRPVIVVPTTPENLATFKAAGGAALILNGTSIILYDFNAESNPVIRNHIIAHECGHHAQILSINTMDRNTLENDADCTASKILVQQLGYGDKEFMAIGVFLRKYVNNGEERAINVLRCAGPG